MFRLGCYWIDKSSLGINVTGKLQAGFIYSHAQNEKFIFRLDKLFSWGWRGTWIKSKSKSLCTADGNAKSSRCCENQCGGRSVKSNYVCYMTQLYHFSLFSQRLHVNISQRYLHISVAAWFIVTELNLPVYLATEEWKKMSSHPSGWDKHWWIEQYKSYSLTWVDII